MGMTILKKRKEALSRFRNLSKIKKYKELFKLNKPVCS
jgi:hypothetical protein